MIENIFYPRNKKTGLWPLILALVFSVSFISCDNDDDDPMPTGPTENILEIAQGNDDFNSLVAALEAAGIANLFSGTTDYTVFAPTDAAFEALFAANNGIDELGDIPQDQLIEILQYHVVAGSAMSSTLNDGDMIPTLLQIGGSAVPVDISISGTTVMVNNATVVLPDVEATNGVIHAIDQVLLPPAEATLTILDVAGSTDDVSTLNTAVASIDAIVTALSGDGPFTVFAPVNAAFDAFIQDDDRFSSIQDLLDNPDLLAEVLQYHVVSGELFAGDINDGDALTTLQGEDIAVAKANNTITLNGVAEVVGTVNVRNGIIHLIDYVVLPPTLQPKSIVELAVEAEGLSILEEAVTRTGFEDILNALSDESANLTVFAPTNDAFGDLLTALGLSSLSEVPDYVLREILTYHVVPAEAFSADLMSQDYSTLNGDMISVDLSSGVVLNGSVNVITTTPGETFDIEATNGVVHLIDAVLLPDLIVNSLGTVLQPALFDAEGRFTTLVEAVRKAELVDVLTSPGLNNMDGFTVFAPTNDAFAAAGIDQAYLDGLDMDGVAALTDVLLYHVLGLTADAATVASLDGDGDMMITVGTALADKSFYVTLAQDGAIFINGNTQVIIPDLTADNGVVHVIDGVLMPPMSDVVDIAIAASEADENAEFTALVAALTRTVNEGETNLVDVLKGEGPFTIFAPTDAAFTAFLDGAELSSIPIETLVAVLTYHVVPGRIFDKDLANLSSNMVTTVQGSDITVNLTEDPVSITDNSPSSSDANIVDVNILGTNGVIHVIDTVLDPRSE